MCKKFILLAVMLTMVLGLMSMSAVANNVTIDTSGATPFLYGDTSYLPLQSVASFLGADLSWDQALGQAVMNYQGKDLVMTPNSRKGSFVGQSIDFTSPPVVINGRTYIPTEAFKKFYDVPVEWDKTRSEVKIKGSRGWGTAKVKHSPPWNDGPPSWAPAWGERRKQGVSNSLTPGNQDQRKGEWKQKSKTKVKQGPRHSR